MESSLMSFDRTSTPTNNFHGVQGISPGFLQGGMIEFLQTQIKMKEGEINQLQGQITMLEKTRSSMTEEIVRLTNENELFGSNKILLAKTKKQLHEIQTRHEAALTLYEKLEEKVQDFKDLDKIFKEQMIRNLELEEKLNAN